VCGSKHEEFHTNDRMAFAIFTCGVDVIAAAAVSSSHSVAPPKSQTPSR